MPRKRLRADMEPVVELPASMRPGLLCPGKGSPTGTACSPSRCFNEAGAVMPRKRPATSASGADSWAGFNEAGAVMPRKSYLVQRADGKYAQASMRPGLLCPGKG